MGVTEQLARFAVETDGRFLTASLAESAKAKMLDTFATMIAGSQAPSAKISLKTMEEIGGIPQATVIGWGRRTSMPSAGFVNGVSAHALEYDDNTTGIGHVSGCVLPGCLAVAEHLDLSGRRLVEAFAMGFEVFCRIAYGLRPFIIDRGWHPQAVIGAQGVAVAASRMFGLDQMATRIKDEKVHRLMHRVKVTVPKDLERHKGQWGENGVNWGEARITVRLKDGSILRQACSHAKGWPERPCSWQDLCEKFEDCAAAVLDKGQIGDAIATIAKLEELHSVRDLIGLLVPMRAR